MTGQYLGQGNLTPNDDGSATATWTGYAENWNGFPWGTPSYNLGVGGYSVIAVYGGDANFTGSQSGGAAMNVVGEPITITNAVVGDYFCYSVVYEGDDGVLQGDVSGLDGAGYTLNVDWGDGQSGGSGTQTFSFPKGGAFSVPLSICSTTPRGPARRRTTLPRPLPPVTAQAQRPRGAQDDQRHRHHREPDADGGHRGREPARGRAGQCPVEPDVHGGRRGLRSGAGVGREREL